MATKRRKTQAERRDDPLKVMMTTDEKRKVEDAASAAHLDTSSWVRMVLLREAGKGAG